MVKSVTRTIARMVKSTASTVSCPIKPFAVQAGPGVSFFVLTYMKPEIELFRVFMNSVGGKSVHYTRQTALVLTRGKRYAAPDNQRFRQRWEVTYQPLRDSESERVERNAVGPGR